jgi:hypothetical protein
VWSGAASPRSDPSAVTTISRQKTQSSDRFCNVAFVDLIGVAQFGGSIDFMPQPPWSKPQIVNAGLEKRRCEGSEVPSDGYGPLQGSIVLSKMAIK